MPELMTLSDGEGWGMALRPAPVPRAVAVSRHLRAAAPRRPRAGRPSPQLSRMASYVCASCDSQEELSAAGEAYERLASMVLSRKLVDESPVGRSERRQMLSAAGMPGCCYANPATEAVFAADANNLGKGGFIGSISHAVSQVANVAKRIAAPVTNTVNAFTGAVSGLSEAASHATVGIASGLANTATSLANNPRAVTGLVGALTGDPSLPQQILGPAAGPVVGSPGSVDSTSLLMIGGAIVVVFLLMGKK